MSEVKGAGGARGGEESGDGVCGHLPGVKHAVEITHGSRLPRQVIPSALRQVSSTILAEVRHL